MSDETSQDIAQDVFRHNLKASEKTRELFIEFPQEEAEDALLSEFDELMGKINNEQQAEDAAMLMQRLAQGLESQRLAQAVMQEADENPLLVVEEGPQ